MRISLYVLVFLILIPSLLLFFIICLIVRPRPRPARITIKNRHVFITGGSRRIGLAIAIKAASEGARVSILARSLKRLEEARASIRLTTDVEAAIFRVDVRDTEVVASAVHEVGPINVLICSHGVFALLELEKQHLEDIKFIIDVNFMGTFYLIKAALRAMNARAKETGTPASIAIMSSQAAGQLGIFGNTAYSASKFALRRLSEALQQEVIADNIYVSLIFSPDTGTLGFAQEHEIRPELTNSIAGSSGWMKVKDVAKASLSGIKSGRFIIPGNLNRAMLATATSGFAPQSSRITALIKVAGAGLVRLCALFYQWYWYTLACPKLS